MNTTTPSGHPQITIMISEGPDSPDSPPEIVVMTMSHALPSWAMEAITGSIAKTWPHLDWVTPIGWPLPPAGPDGEPYSGPWTYLH